MLWNTSIHTFQDPLHILSSDKIHVDPTIRYTNAHWFTGAHIFVSPVTMGYDVQYILATTVDTCINSTRVLVPLCLGRSSAAQ